MHPARTMESGEHMNKDGDSFCAQEEEDREASLALSVYALWSTIHDHTHTVGTNLQRPTVRPFGSDHVCRGSLHLVRHAVAAGALSADGLDL